MASAIDSGVDTGNDSNDSSVQEKLSKMDLENSSQAILPDSVNENSAEDQGVRLTPQKLVTPEGTSQVALVGSGPHKSYMHISTHVIRSVCDTQPKPPSSETCLVLSLRPGAFTREVGSVFVSGGPFGTEYKGSPLETKLRARLRHGLTRFKCLRHSGCQATIANYCKHRDAVKMCRAACQNNTEAMREMLEAGLSPNVHDTYKRTPLHLAACMGFADMVKLLLDYGADPNAKDSIGNTPLHLAACTNHVAVITLLLKAGTRVSERDMAGYNPLQLAITKFNIMKRSITPHPVLKEQVCQVISMLTEYMRRKEGATIDPDLLNKFESLVRVSDSTEQVENNIRDLLSNLSSLNISGNS